MRPRCWPLTGRTIPGSGKSRPGMIRRTCSARTSTCGPDRRIPVQPGWSAWVRSSAVMCLPAIAPRAPGAVREQAHCRYEAESQDQDSHKAEHEVERSEHPSPPRETTRLPICAASGRSGSGVAGNRRVAGGNVGAAYGTTSRARCRYGGLPRSALKGRLPATSQCRGREAIFAGQNHAHRPSSGA